MITLIFLKIKNYNIQANRNLKLKLTAFALINYNSGLLSKKAGMELIFHCKSFKIASSSINLTTHVFKF